MIARKDESSIKREFAVICLGCVLLLCGYNSCFVLQTSINVEKGLGSKTVTSTYATVIAMSLFVGPFLLRVLGPKKVMISAECAYIVYVAANFYPRPIFMAIGGIVAGYAEGFYWLVIYVVVAHYGTLFHEYTGKPLSACVLRFSSIGYGIIQCNQILGNIFTFFILHFLRDTPTSVVNYNATQPTPIANSTELNQALIFNPTLISDVAVPRSDFGHCGINDCQEENITKTNIDQYVPTNPIAIYSLMGCFIFLMAVGMFLHIVLMPEVSLDVLNRNIAKRNGAAESFCVDKNTDENGNVELLKRDVIKSVKSGEKLYVDKTMDENGNVALMKGNVVMKNRDGKSVGSDKTTDYTGNGNVEAQESKSSKKSSQVFVQSLVALKDTFYVFFSFHQFIITPYSIYYGFAVSFLYSETSRAFVSCVLGVSKVGLSVVCFSTGFIITCIIVGKFFVKRGKLPLLIAAHIFDMVLYASYLLWKPSLETAAVIFIFCVLTGIATILRTIVITECYASGFYKSKEVSFNILTATCAVGYALQFGISTLLCVREKVYILIIFANVSALMAGLLEVKGVRSS